MAQPTEIFNFEDENNTPLTNVESPNLQIDKDEVTPSFQNFTETS